MQNNLETFDLPLPAPDRPFQLTWKYDVEEV